MKIYQTIEKDKISIEEKIGKMNWYPLEEKCAKIISISIDNNFLEEPEYVKAWVVEMLDKFMTVFPKKYFKK